MTDGKHEAKGLETQSIWYQRQRWLRTALQTAIAFLVGLGGSVALLQATAPQVLDALAGVLPANWLTGLAAVFAFVIAIASALSKLMAIPVVNVWLTRVGFGSEPRAVAKERAAAKTPELRPAQFTPTATDLRDEQGDERPTAL